MRKKVRYSKTLVDLWRIYRKHYAKLKLDPDSLYIRMKSDLYKIYPIHQDPDNHARAITSFEMWYKDFSEEMTHLYFIDRELKYKLREMNLTDLEGVKEYLGSVGTERNAFISKTNNETNIVSYDFALHIPFEKHGFSFSLVLTEDLNLVLQVDDGKSAGAIPEDRYHKLANSKDEDEQYLASTFRLAVNLLAYMQCFPDLVKDGVPTNIPDEYDGSSLTIGTAESLTHSSESDKKNSPHFRKAHFRYLGSDYFTNKKGQIVLVQETMVNGKAKTIHTASDLSKLNHDKV
ncbi:MAG: hypothetical protein WD053_06440 [Gracilimonas sp.]